MPVPLHFQTLAELADRLAQREISSLALTRAVISRTEAVEKSFRAFNSRDAADALAQAEASDARRAAGQSRGPLDGIPVGLKDVIAAKDQPLTASSRMLPESQPCWDGAKTGFAASWCQVNGSDFNAHAFPM